MFFNKLAFKNQGIYFCVCRYELDFLHFFCHFRVFIIFRGLARVKILPYPVIQALRLADIDNQALLVLEHIASGQFRDMLDVGFCSHWSSSLYTQGFIRAVINTFKAQDTLCPIFPGALIISYGNIHRAYLFALAA